MKTWDIVPGFRLSIWQYLFAKPSRRSNRWTAFWCRLGGHKCGPVWYNPDGMEPDMRCKNCGDEL